MGANVPCLAALEVWAKLENERSHKKLFTDIENEKKAKAENVTGCFYADKDETSETEQVEKSSTPSELLDELTSQPMSTPLMLPSGHLVDEQTLTKYNLEEEKWGRLPNDPFTRRPFTSELKPVYFKAD